ncbi:MAG: sensor domain-containing diguanylate cyclase [Synergistaceae bacterium]|nr:sensor domain-containing diguanylate cyclase [Synergistaceae bacterium]
MRQDFEQMLNILREGVYFVDLDRKITFWNKAAERISGYRSDEVLGSSCKDNILIHVDSTGRNLCDDGCPLHATMADRGIRMAEVFLHHRRGYRVPVSVRTTPLEDEVGNVVGGIEIFTEISPEENIRLRMEELERWALLDPLTKVPSRTHLKAELEALFSLWEKVRRPFGVLFIDIDHFKMFNDNHGHHVGDEVLKIVAKSLSVAVRLGDVIGRWGGEEFVGLFPEVEPVVLSSLAERLRTMVENSWIYEKPQRLAVAISIGGTISREGDTPSSILERADALMYQSKKAGRNRVTIG